MEQAEQLLITTCAAWGIHLTEQQREQFARYANELRFWNERINLTAIVDPLEIYRRHFLDSLSLAAYWGTPPNKMIDLGTGAGFPGLPLKIIYPQIALTLADSVGKKTEFLQGLVRSLGLADVRVINARAETLGRDAKERQNYDLVTARAVADLRVLVEYGLPLVRVGGHMIAPKGASAQDEVRSAGPAIEQLGGQIEAVEAVQIPELEARSLVLIKKVRSTDVRYPRAPGIPTRRPL